MKREATHRGGGPTCGEQLIANYGQAVGKILTKKKVTKLSKAKVKRIAARRIGAEAALEQLGDAELCRDLAWKFAREFAKKTGDTIGDVLDRYEAIALGFAAVGSVLTGGVAHPAVFRYSLRSVLRSSYQTDEALRAFLAKLDKWVRDYIWACTRAEQDNYSWILCRYPVSRELRIMLAYEYARDRQGLMRFLQEVFKRWRKIDQPESLFRQRLLTHQLAGTPKEIANALEEIGAAPTCTTAKQVESFHARIRQYRSRDRKAASKRRGL